MSSKHFAVCLLALYVFNILSIEDLRKNEWESTEFIWDFGIISSCEKGLNKRPIQYFETEHTFDASAYHNIQKGDIVWIRGRFLEQFSKQIFPETHHPFVLVISDGDESFPSDCTKNKNLIKQLISNGKIIHIFAQNCDYKGQSKKITHLPIGLDYHTIAYKGPQGGWGETGSPLEQEACLKSILKNLQPTFKRKKKAFVDFQLSDTMHAEHKRYLQWGEDRATIYNRLSKTGLVDSAAWMRRSDLWKKKGEYAFSISPHGNGLDCHRTWEDLILGCIVIVKTSPLDPLYKGLPVVIIKDWSEITQKNMSIWLFRYGNAFSHPAYREKLTHRYWLNKIRMAASPHKSFTNIANKESQKNDQTLDN